MCRDDVSRLLRAAAQGDPNAVGTLLPRIYAELRTLAHARMRQERPGHTLEATELVHEAYLRLVQGTQVEWAGRGHFFAAAAEAMRRILIEHARSRGRAKHGGDGEGRAPERLPLTLPGVANLAVDSDPDTVLALDEAIARLERRDRRIGQVVRLRYYAGLSIEESAAALNVSPRTIKRDWAFARAWLYEALSRLRD